MKVFLFLILILSCGALTACGGSPFVNEEHRVICVGEDDGIEEVPFIASEHQTYNFGAVENKLAWYRPKPSGGSRQTVIYKNDKYEETKDELCSGGVDEKEYKKLSNKLLKYSITDGPYISTSTDQDPIERSKVIFYESDKITSEKVDLEEYNFIVRYSPEIGINFLIRQEGQSILIGFFGLVKERPVKEFVCEKLKFVKENIQFGDQPNTKIQIPSCKKLFKESL